MTTEASTKLCPFCAETIQAAAIVCRYCGRDLVEKPAEQPIATHTALKMPADGGANWQCSACQGYIRRDAEQCKHCKARLTGEGSAPAAAPTTQSSSSRAPVIGILLTVLLACVAIWLMLPSGRSGGTSSIGVSSSQIYKITYRVKGTAGGASLTYENAQSGTEQKEVRLPWESSFSARAGQFLYLSAQNSGEYGTVTCEILLDGLVVKTSTSEGAYKIAGCSGKL